MIPTKIVITPEGNQKLEGLEKSAGCDAISQMAKRAGKVTEDKMKDHPTVHQTVDRR
jgi:hypothetical protein